MGNVYTVDRTSEKVIVRDSDGHPVYSLPKDSFVIYKRPVVTPGDDSVTVEKVSDLEDMQLLKALASAIKLDKKP